MKNRKWKRFWKDNDFVILISGKVDERKFFESMIEISQKMFGVPNPSIFHKFFEPIGYKNEKERD